MASTTDSISPEPKASFPAIQDRWRIVSLGAVLGAILFTVLLPSTRRVAGSNSEEVVLLDFTASWCSPCQKISPLIDQLEKEGNTVRRVDVDQEPNIAARYNVKSVPTFVLTVGGQEVGRVRGADSETEQKLRNLLAKAPLAVRGQDPAASFSDSPVLAPVDPTIGGRIRLGAASPFPSELQPPSAKPQTTPRSDLLAEVPRSMGQQPQNSPGPAHNFDRGPSADFGWPDLPRRNRQPERTPRPMTMRGQSNESTNLEYLAMTPLSVSTRLRVREGSKQHFGSGTIIDSKPGQSIILTCAHILEGMERGEKLLVEVDVFDAKSQPVTFVGRVLGYDLDADVGLIGISCTTTLPVARLAAASDTPALNTPLVSIGCGGGDLPSEEKILVTAINRYEGPDSIECTGLPTLGRSGGGLFRNDMNLVGVSIAANQSENRGVYAGIGPVITLIQKVGLSDRILGDSAIAQGKSARPAPSLADSMPEPNSASRERSPFDANLAAGLVPAGIPSTLSDNLTSGAATSETEIICIVRSKNPNQPSRVIVIHDPNPELIDSLSQEGAEPISNLTRRAIEVVQEAQQKWGRRDSLVNRDAITRSRTSLTQDHAEPSAPLQPFGVQE